MASAAEIVTAIDSAILSFVSSGGSSELEIPGVGRRRFSSLAELKQLRAYYAGLVNSAGMAGGTSTPFVQFNIRPGRAT